jgi:Cu+-exporting ATPase
MIIGACERPSEHPLARAIVHAADDLDIGVCDTVEEFESTTGSGVFGHLSNPWRLLAAPDSEVVSERYVDGELGLDVYIGGRGYVNTMTGCVPNEEDEATARELEEQGQTVVFVALRVNSLCQLAGLVAIADSIRPEAQATVSALKTMGIECWMASGDNRRTALAIAREAGIVHVLAEVKPEEKAAKVRQLKRGGDRVVAMVGDGVNDSIAIAESDVGIAVGAGSDVAIEAASVVLMTSDLRGVLIAIHLSKHVFRRIQLNLLFSLGYNTLGIPIAAGCLFPVFEARMPPEVAALAMALSSVSVVLSSLQLRWYRPPIVGN